MSRNRNAGKNNKIYIPNRPFENVAQFKYLGTTVTNQNLINEEIKNRLNLGDVCNHWFQTLLHFLLPKAAKIKILKTIILPVILYGCKTCSLKFRREHALMEFENRVLRRISGPKRYEIRRGWRKLHNEGLHKLNSSPYRITSQEGWDGLDM
jgi:hypothetical protein